MSSAAASAAVRVVRSTTRAAAQPRPQTAQNATDIVDHLLEYTSELISPDGPNLIAYSGGVDSSLAAALVHHATTTTDTTAANTASSKAVLGVSPAVPRHQIDLARIVAQHIGIEMIEVDTTESADPVYVANEGQACFACKTALYSALNAVVDYANYGGNSEIEAVLFNGTNADDRQDETRVGLIAADNFSVASPLRYTTKDEVRLAAKHLNLPNWNHAASPCLRSRLALGVEATRDHLNQIEEAEAWVRRVLQIEDDVTRNLRVRLLAGKRAVVELDSKNVEDCRAMLMEAGVVAQFGRMGFTGGLAQVRAFKSGSVATVSK